MSTDPATLLAAERNDRLANPDAELAALGAQFMRQSVAAKYQYNYDWLGRPVIHYPQDIAVVQELIWRVRPDLIIETGIAHGGSLILSASMLALLDYCDAAEQKTNCDPQNPRRKVIGVDIDIRSHNRAAIDTHPLRASLELIEGSSTDEKVVDQMHEQARKADAVMVMLDSNHTHEHVLAELEAYAPAVTPGSYLVVFDTVVEKLPAGMHLDRPWDPGNSPMTAARSYLEIIASEGRKDLHGKPLWLEADMRIDAKTVISEAPEGYLYRPE